MTIHSNRRGPAVRNARVRAAQPTLEGALRWAFLVAVIFSVVPFGTVHEGWFNLSVILVAAVFITATLVPYRNRSSRRLAGAALVTVLAASAYIGLQAVWFSGNPFAHAMWEPAGRVLGFDGGSISVAPGMTLRAIPHLAIPFLVFILALVLNQDDGAAQATWQRLAVFGAVVAVYGIIQQVFFPAWVLFDERQVSDSLRAVFINRNNTAAYLAVAALALLGLIVSKWQNLSADVFFQRLKSFNFRDRPKYLLFVVYLFLLFVTVIAIFLTKSRAGVAFGSVSLLSAMLFWLRTARSRKMTLMRRGGGVAIVVLIAVVFAQAFAARTVQRAEMSGVDEHRLCTYKATLAGIVDHPVFGTGFGTFVEIYPTYRPAECGISGTWVRAHNSYLEGYLGLGAPFLVLLGACVYFVGRTLRAGIKERRRLRSIPIAGAGMMLFMGLHSLLDFPIQINGIAVYFAALIGTACAVSLARRTRREAV